MILESGLVFVRHAQSIGNVMSQDERAQHEISNIDYPLTELGRKQAEVTGRWLREHYGARITGPHFCSMFVRSEETLRINLETMGRGSEEIIRTPLINEKWDGIFHELSKVDLTAQYPDQVALRKSEGYFQYRAPRGENGPDVEQRARSFVKEHLVENGGLRLVVGHGRWFLFLQKLLHDLTVKQFLDLKSLDRQKNCAVTIYEKGRPIEIPPTYVPWEGLLADSKTEFA